MGGGGGGGGGIYVKSKFFKNVPDLVKQIYSNHFFILKHFLDTVEAHI